MKRSLAVLGLALVAAVTVSGAALAQSTVEAARQWGLLGTWAVDCDRPASRSNTYLIYVARDGRLFHDRNFGDSRDSSPIPTATIKSDQTLELVFDLQSISQTRQAVFLKSSDGRYRSMSNRNVKTDEYSIRDGKFTSNGEPAPWITRCR
jgi:hypothetical protein